MNHSPTTSKNNYKQIAQKKDPKRPLVKNCIRAFLIGGAICTIGQCISFFYMYFFNFTEQTVGNPTTATLIFLTMLLTGFGFYDDIAQFAGAGTAVPVTGFGNAVISAAIEHRSEGFVQGVGGNMFKLAGSVILFGVFSAFVLALIKTILLELGVI
ncbi:stage V sporulation protein AC [Paraliobacillus ryukyuensis]|uniref:stage V sporulation protein AC n=1 Tax=Paraliobacillus ryukyuensis TaxID=200904 RepID=UPI0009A61FDC|nr:stage V sporulation protein AC [Paraliobacillus ryukyuensis]